MENNNKLNSYYGASRRREVADIIPKFKTSPKILEIGCGVGGFSKNFDSDCEYWGVEPWKDAAIQAEKILFKVFAKTYDEARMNLPNGYFDLIVLNDVIEHINETHFFVLSLKQLLSPEGLIVGSVPNVRFSDNLYRMLILKDWHYVENGILDKTHLRFFTKKSLIRLFSEVNLEVKIIKGIGKPAISFNTGRQFFYSLGLKIIPYIFGSDSNFLQYAFLVKPAFSNTDSK